MLIGLIIMSEHVFVGLNSWLSATISTPMGCLESVYEVVYHSRVYTERSVCWRIHYHSQSAVANNTSVAFVHCDSSALQASSYQNQHIADHDRIERRYFYEMNDKSILDLKAATSPIVSILRSLFVGQFLSHLETRIQHLLFY